MRKKGNLIIIISLIIVSMSLYIFLNNKEHYTNSKCPTFIGIQYDTNNPDVKNIMTNIQMSINTLQSNCGPIKTQLMNLNNQLVFLIKHNPSKIPSCDDLTKQAIATLQDLKSQNILLANDVLINSLTKLYSDVLSIICINNVVNPDKIGLLLNNITQSICK